MIDLRSRHVGHGDTLRVVTPSLARQARPSKLRLRLVSAWLAAVALTAMATAFAQDAVIALEGRVVAEDTGKPLAGARIMLTQDQSFARTDASGRFELAVPASQPFLTVVKPGYVRTVARASRGQRTLVVRMPRGGVVTVYVFDPSGEPLVGASVDVSGGGNGRSMSARMATSDRGEVRVANLIEGRYTVSVGGRPAVQVRLPPRELSDAEVVRVREELARRSTAPTPQPLAAVNVRAGQETSIYLLDVSPAPTASTVDLSGMPRDGTAAIEGRVVDADGQPVAGAHVSVLRGLDGRGATSDASGAFTIDHLTPGTFTIAASKRGFAFVNPETAARRQTVSLDQGKRLEGLTLTLVPASEITGSVVDEFGEPVERANVQLLRMGVSADGTIRLNLVGGGASDERGRYRIPHVSPGAYALLTVGDIFTQGQVHLFYPGVLSLDAAHLLDVSEGRDVSGIEFRLNPDLGHRLFGTVVGSAGGATGGTVYLTGTDARGVVIPRRMAGLTRAGAFEFLNVAPGNYSLFVPPPLSIPPVLNGQVVRPSAAPESGGVRIQVGDAPPGPVVIRTSPGGSAPP